MFTPNPLEISYIEQLETAYIHNNDQETDLDNQAAVVAAENFLYQLSQAEETSHALNTFLDDETYHDIKKFLNKSVGSEYFDRTWGLLEETHGSKVLVLTSPEGISFTRPDNLLPPLNRK